MNRTISIVALAGITALTLVACWSENDSDFDDETQRNESLIEYTCQRMQEDEAPIMYSTAAYEYRKLPQYQNLDAADKASVERSINMAMRGAYSPTCDPTDEINYQPWAVQGYMHHLEDSDFNFEEAKSRGLV